MPLDEISIFVHIEYIKNFSIKFVHEIKKENMLLANGYMEHAGINQAGEFVELPGWVWEKFSKYIIPED